MSTLRAGHPRLLLTSDDLATAQKSAHTDPLRAALHARVIATAETLLDAPVPQHIPASNASLDQARYAVHTILTTALAFRLTGEQRFFVRAKRELLTVAAFPDWNPAHFLDVGETGFATAMGYDWLYDELTADERALLKNALVEKAIRPALTAYNTVNGKSKAVEWASVTSNWNQVCNAGALCAALAIADEEPDLARQIIAGARASIPRGMAVYAPDGEHPEGPGYWTFGTTYTVIALAALESALGNDLELSKASGFARTTDFPIIVQGPSGRAFNFADCTEDEQNSPARAWLAQRFNRATAMRATRALLAESLSLEKVTPFDPKIQGQVVNRFFPLQAVWFPTEPATTDASDMPLDVHLRGVADLAIFRSSWTDPRALYVGFKAGENAYRHNHLDLGSFVLDADGVRWATDLGPDVYELPGMFDYKGTARWEFFRINNRSHNTVTPGDALQRRKVTAPILAFSSTPEKAFAIANLAPAYPDEAKSLLRGIALLDRSRVLVQDEFVPAHPSIPLRWTMMTRANIALDDAGRIATLSLDGRTLKAEILEPTAARFSIESAKPPTAAENQNTEFVRLTIDWTSTSPETSTRLAVLFTPQSADSRRLSPPVLQPLADWK